MGREEHVLFLFAHQDDEVGIAPRIVREVAAGNIVHCAYLTNGEAKGVSAATRCAESSRVLGALGAGKIDIAFIGNEVGIPDGGLAENLGAVLEAVIGWIRSWKAPPCRLYFLAWEGGHHDHDAVHILGLVLAQRYAVGSVSQFPLYNGYRTWGRFFKVMRPLPNWKSPSVAKLTLREGLRYALLPLGYPSQWRTWLGLFPGVFRQYVLRRKHEIFPIDHDAVYSAPHDGRLLYERMFAIDRAQLISRHDVLHPDCSKEPPPA